MEHSHLLERSALEGTYVAASVSWAQLEPGTFDVCYGVVDAAPLEISYRHFNLGFMMQAQVTPPKTMIGILADRRTNARWFGTPVDGRSIAATRSAIDLRTEGPGSFYEATLDGPRLQREFPAAPDALALLEDLDDVTLAQNYIGAARLRASMQRLFSITQNAQVALLPHGLPLRLVSGTLVPLLADAIQTLNVHAIEPSKSVNRRLAAVRVCEEYMREHVDSAITLLDLSQACGMRSRSLINAFAAVTGFSPMDYLKRLRLHGVHRALRRANKVRTRIIDVATAWGFWHMGHFATDYRSMFGEAPSQTLLK